MKPLIYLLVDFENLQPAAEDVALVRGEHYRLWIFRGPHQKTYDAAMAEAWQPLGERVTFVQSSKQGKNALDFHIAFCLGQLHQENTVLKQPARYVVVSKDGGFNALLDYMRALPCWVAKATSIPESLLIADQPEPMQPAAPNRSSAVRSEVADKVAPTQTTTPLQRKSAAKSTAKTLRKTFQTEDVERVIEYLRLHPKNRPAKRATLEHHVISILANAVTAAVSRAVIAELERLGVVNLKEKTIEYKIPRRKKSA